MCQNIAVKTVVDGFVAKGYMFTAFDVTKFLRISGSQVKHSEVNSAVKQMFRDSEMPDYLRDVKDVGAPVAPFVYYHQNADLDNYVTDWLENNPDQDGMKNDGTTDDGSGKSVAGVAQPAPSAYGSSTAPTTAPASTVKPVLPKGVKVTDNEGRLYIAPVVTHGANLVPYQSVWLVVENNKVLVKRCSVANSKAVMVNGDGRIRICRTVLKPIAKLAKVGYKVEDNCGTIEVVPV